MLFKVFFTGKSYKEQVRDFSDPKEVIYENLINYQVYDKLLTSIKTQFRNNGEFFKYLLWYYGLEQVLTSYDESSLLDFDQLRRCRFDFVNNVLKLHFKSETLERYISLLSPLITENNIDEFDTQISNMLAIISHPESNTVPIEIGKLYNAITGFRSLDFTFSDRVKVDFKIEPSISNGKLVFNVSSDEVTVSVSTPVRGKLVYQASYKQYLSETKFFIASLLSTYTTYRSTDQNHIIKDTLDSSGFTYKFLFTSGLQDFKNYLNTGNIQYLITNLRIFKQALEHDIQRMQDRGVEFVKNLPAIVTDVLVFFFEKIESMLRILAYAYQLYYIFEHIDEILRFLVPTLFTFRLEGVNESELLSKINQRLSSTNFQTVKTYWLQILLSEISFTQSEAVSNHVSGISLESVNADSFLSSQISNKICYVELGQFVTEGTKNLGSLILDYPNLEKFKKTQQVFTEYSYPIYFDFKHRKIYKLVPNFPLSDYISNTIDYFLNQGFTFEKVSLDTHLELMYTHYANFKKTPRQFLLNAQFFDAIPYLYENEFYKKFSLSPRILFDYKFSNDLINAIINFLDTNIQTDDIVLFFTNIDHIDNQTKIYPRSDISRDHHVCQRSFSFSLDFENTLTLDFFTTVPKKLVQIIPALSKYVDYVEPNDYLDVLDATGRDYTYTFILIYQIEFFDLMIRKQFDELSKNLIITNYSLQIKDKIMNTYTDSLYHYFSKHLR